MSGISCHPPPIHNDHYSVHTLQFDRLEQYSQLRSFYVQQKLFKEETVKNDLVWTLIFFIYYYYLPLAVLMSEVAC